MNSDPTLLKVPKRKMIVGIEEEEAVASKFGEVQTPLLFSYQQ